MEKAEARAEDYRVRGEAEILRLRNELATASQKREQAEAASQHASPVATGARAQTHAKVALGAHIQRNMGLTPQVSK